MSTAVHVIDGSPFADSRGHLLAGLAVVDVRIRWAVFRARENGLNPHDEFRGLYIADEQVDQLLTYDMGQHIWSENGHHSAAFHQSWHETISQAYAVWHAQTNSCLENGRSLRLAHLINAFSLTPQEVEAFLLTIAPEIDPRYAQIFAYLHDDVTKKRPSIGLLLNLLTDDFGEKLALRQLFGRNGRLIQSGLLEITGDRDDNSLLMQSIRPAPHVIEFLLGDDQLDPKLQEVAQLYPVAETSKPQRVSTDLLQKLLHLSDAAPPPLYAFFGSYGTGKLEAAQHLAAQAERPLLRINCTKLAASNLNLHTCSQWLLRDGRLFGAVLFLEEWERLLVDNQPPDPLFSQLLAYPHIVVLASQTAWQTSNRARPRPLFAISFPAPDFNGRLAIWQQHLGGESALDLTAVANHFRFTPGQIEDAIATARDLAHWREDDLTNEDLFAASRAHSNQNLARLATKIQPRCSWEDIVLPQDTLNQLHEMVNTVKHRPTVYDKWGFNHKLALGKGLSALFAGESGTGKTMSADIMATVLGLALYKVDLSTVVSKYIGETEKNLDRIFTEAATSNAILFFDEADAIFGKRSEIKDSHDRYANIEISYLLQRMEMYDGVVILATNLRANLDDAFTRRLHFVVEFPFPEAADRERIWHVNVPQETPLAPDVDFKVLAQRLRIPGGNIRNIILAAAFLAAEDKQPVGMRHLLHSAQREYQKLGRLIDEKLFTLPPTG
ncbi:MAG: hypothetical protein CSB13_03100 [Chloroflexi bacterium]|nr:MAG: hypothetical protein CSB13_03100 [Chloroflexota bacterium]